MKVAWIGIVCIIAATGCATMQPAARLDMDEWKETYTVKGLNNIAAGQQLSFGDYHTTSIRCNTSRATGQAAHPENISWTAYEEQKQTIRFSMTGNWGLSADAYCIRGIHVQEITAINHLNGMIREIGAESGTTFSPENVFAAILKTRTHPTSWQMLVAAESEPGNNRFTGYLARDKDNFYTVFSSGSPVAGQAAYAFRNRAGQTVATVSMLNKGVVILAHVSGEEKFLLANACTALMLKNLMAAGTGK